MVIVNTVEKMVVRPDVTNRQGDSVFECNVVSSAMSRRRGTRIYCARNSTNTGTTGPRGGFTEHSAGEQYYTTTTTTAIVLCASDACAGHQAPRTPPPP